MTGAEPGFPDLEELRADGKTPHSPAMTRATIVLVVLVLASFLGSMIDQWIIYSAPSALKGFQDQLRFLSQFIFLAAGAVLVVVVLGSLFQSRFLIRSPFSRAAGDFCATPPTYAARVLEATVKLAFSFAAFLSLAVFLILLLSIVVSGSPFADEALARAERILTLLSALWALLAVLMGIMARLSVRKRFPSRFAPSR